MSAQRISKIAICLSAAAGMRLGEEVHTGFLQMDGAKGAVAADAVPASPADPSAEAELAAKLKEEEAARVEEQKKAYRKAVHDAEQDRDRLTMELISMIKSGTVAEVMENDTPAYPITADEVAAVMHNNVDVRNFLSSEEQAKQGTPPPAGGPSWETKSVDYGMNTVSRVLASEQADDAELFNVFKVLDMPREVAYLAAQPIYKLGQNGIREVDGFEVLCRAPDGTHSAPSSLFRDGGYQTQATQGGDAGWARMQILWAKFMARRLAGRVNFISINFRLDEIAIPAQGEIESVEDMMIRATRENASDVKLVFEITEYDQYKPDKHLPILKRLAASGVALALDDELPEELEIAGLPKGFVRFGSGGAKHATTYENGQTLQREVGFSHHKVEGKHSQRLFATELCSFNDWQIINPKNTGAAKAVIGSWSPLNADLSPYVPRVNPMTKVNGKPLILEDGLTVGVDMDFSPAAVLQDPIRFVAVAKWLQYVIDTVKTAKNQGQKIDRFVIEATVTEDNINDPVNVWFKQILVALEETEQKSVMFATQGGATADFGFPVDIFGPESAGTTTLKTKVEFV